MSQPPSASDPDGPTDCTTTRSFDDHGVDDGVALITRTYYRLRDSPDGAAFEPTAEWFDRIETAFEVAYLNVTGEHRIPSHVARAIEDARAWTHDEFADRPDAELRTEVLPAFYQRVAGFHCAYRA
jgi:hypothetical protein